MRRDTPKLLIAGLLAAALMFPVTGAASGGEGLADAGNVAWDMASYEWLLDNKTFDSINPSLQRQAIFNMAYGLHEVLPGKIWQVRVGSSSIHSPPRRPPRRPWTSPAKSSASGPWWRSATVP